MRTNDVKDKTGKASIEAEDPESHKLHIGNLSMSSCEIVPMLNLGLDSDDSSDDLNHARESPLSMQERVLQVWQNIRPAPHKASTQLKPKSSEITQRRRQLTEPACWRKANHLDMREPKLPSWVEAGGLKLKTIEIREDEELPEQLTQHVEFLRRHPNTGYKGGLARACLKWMLGLREESWMQAEIKQFSDIDMMVLGEYPGRYGETSEETINYFTTQEKCGSVIEIFPVDIEEVTSFHTYFLDRDITQNMALVWCRADGRVFVVYATIAEQDSLKGIIRVSNIMANLYSSPRPYSEAADGHQYELEKILNRVIRHAINGRGVQIELCAEEWNLLRTDFKNPFFYIAWLHGRDTADWRRVYNYLISLGILERHQDPMEWWGEILYAASQVTGRAGDPLNLKDKEFGVDEVNLWKANLWPRNFAKQQEIDMHRILDGKFVYDLGCNVDLKGLDFPEWLPGADADLSNTSVHRTKNYEDYQQFSTQPIPSQETLFDLPQRMHNMHNAFSWGKDEGRYQQLATSVGSIDGANDLRRRVSKKQDDVLPDKEPFVPVRKALELELIPRDYNYLSLYSTMIFSLKLLRPWALQYSGVLVLIFAAALIRVAAVVNSEGPVPKLVGLIGSLLVSLLADISMTCLMSWVAAGVRSEFVSNNLHRSGQFWSMRERYPEFWSRFAGETGAFESFVSNTFPSLITGFSEVVLILVLMLIICADTAVDATVWTLLAQLGLYTVVIWGLVLAATPFLRGESRIVRQVVGHLFARAFRLMEGTRLLQESGTVQAEVNDYHAHCVDMQFKARPMTLIKKFVPKIFSTMGMIAPFLFSYSVYSVAMLSTQEMSADGEDAGQTKVYGILLLILVYIRAVNSTASAWIQLCFVAGALERYFVLFQAHQNCAEGAMARSLTETIPPPLDELPTPCLCRKSRACRNSSVAKESRASYQTLRRTASGEKMQRRRNSIIAQHMPSLMETHESSVCPEESAQGPTGSESTSVCSCTQTSTQPAIRQARIEIELKDVVFAYPTQMFKACLRLPAQKKFGPGMNVIQIKRGEGASTLGRLLLKHWLVKLNTIFVNGLSIEKVDTQWLRENLTVVDHDVYDDGRTFLDAITAGLTTTVLGQDYANATTNSLTYEKVWKLLELCGLKTALHKLPRDVETVWWHRNFTRHEIFLASLVRACLRDSAAVYIEDPLRHCHTPSDTANVKSLLQHVSDTLQMTVIIATPDPDAFYKQTGFSKDGLSQPIRTKPVDTYTPNTTTTTGTFSTDSFRKAKNLKASFSSFDIDDGPAALEKSVESLLTSKSSLNSNRYALPSQRVNQDKETFPAMAARLRQWGILPPKKLKDINQGHRGKASCSVVDRGSVLAANPMGVSIQRHLFKFTSVVLVLTFFPVLIFTMGLSAYRMNTGYLSDNLHTQILASDKTGLDNRWVLEMLWQPSVCVLDEYGLDETERESCVAKQQTDHFVVHGMFRVKAAGFAHSFDERCLETGVGKTLFEDFDASTIPNITDYWSDILGRGSNESFWEYQFSKHAACGQAGTSANEFFNDVVTLAKKYDPVNIWAAAGVDPSNAKSDMLGLENLSQIYNAAYNGTTDMRVRKGYSTEMGSELLRSFEICFDLHFNPAVCPQADGLTYDGDVIWPDGTLPVRVQ